jgi:DNA-binding response OmpR family regulator
MAHRIMLIEDDKPILEMMEILLKTIGYEPVLEPNVLDALDSVRRDPPDLVLLDIMMTPIDGWEFLRRLRQDVGLVDLPVILFTATSMVEEKIIAMKDPKLGILLKPVTVSELKEGIEKFLKKN